MLHGPGNINHRAPFPPARGRRSLLGVTSGHERGQRLWRPRRCVDNTLRARARRSYSKRNRAPPTTSCTQTRASSACRRAVASAGNLLFAVPLVGSRARPCSARSRCRVVTTLQAEWLSRLHLIGRLPDRAERMTSAIAAPISLSQLASACGHAPKRRSAGRRAARALFGPVSASPRHGYDYRITDAIGISRARSQMAHADSRTARLIRELTMVDERRLASGRSQRPCGGASRPVARADRKLAGSSNPGTLRPAPRGIAPQPRARSARCASGRRQGGPCREASSARSRRA